MSVLELFRALESHPWYIVGFTAGIPILTLLLKPIHGPFRAALAPWKYLYSLIVYLCCIPGIFVLFAALYLTVFQGGNLLALDLVVYALPVLSMILTLVLIRRTIKFDDIPGFRRISGLVAITIATFAVLLILDRLRILLFFRASIFAFLAIAVGVFLAFKLGGHLLFGRRA